ncbi:type VII secretion integral membrane protein EccD [Quadrisphaera sp. RL12-1S]|nr:type VII secretion integral membrane protein EccD [Quadrisphaera sp. RL12-1S]
MTPTGPVDVSLPLGLTTAEVVDELVTSLAPGAPLALEGPWHLHRLGGAPLPPDHPLGAVRPVDGEVLHLTAGEPPPLAVAVDDALDALAAGASSAGRWTSSAATGVLVATAVVLGVTASLAALQVGRASGGTHLLPLALAVVLCGVATQLRRDGGVAVAVAAATLPAWACGGLALAGGADGLHRVLLTAAAAAVGALVAVVVVPAHRAWWVGVATAGTLLAGAAALPSSGALSLRTTAAVVAVVLVWVVAVLPHLMARSSLWSTDSPGDRAREELGRRGRSARQLLTAASTGTAAVIAAAGTVLVLAGPVSDAVLGAVLAAVVALRARRSRFAVESTALAVAGAVVVGAGAGRLAVGTPDQRAWALAIAAVALAGVVAALVVVVRAARGEDALAQRLTRPRVRRALDVAEAVLALGVLPLLGWVLGLYTAASDAAASW